MLQWISVCIRVSFPIVSNRYVFFICLVVVTLTAIAALMIIGAILSLGSAVLCTPGIQMHAVSCIVGIVSGLLFLISVILFAVMDRKFSGYFQKEACLSTSFGCAIAALFLAWCASAVAGIATREEEDDEDY